MFSTFVNLFSEWRFLEVDDDDLETNDISQYEIAENVDITSAQKVSLCFIWKFFGNDGKNQSPMLQYKVFKLQKLYQL